MKNANTPAMPVFPDSETGHAAAFRGLTKREQFAAMAMQGLLSNSGTIDSIGDHEQKWVAARAVEMADQALAELERTND